MYESNALIDFKGDIYLLRADKDGKALLNIFNTKYEKDEFDIMMIGYPFSLNKTESEKLLAIGLEGIIIFESKESHRLIRAY